MFQREIVMTHEEFLEWKYGEYKDININIDITKYIVVGFAFTMFFIRSPVFVYASIETGLVKIDTFGFSLLKVLRRIGYWLSLLSSITEIIKGGLSHKGNNEMFKIIIKYLLIFSSLYFMKDAFDMVKEVFND